MAYIEVGVKSNMKKNINKKVISISVIVVIIIAITGLFYMKSKSTKPEVNEAVTITATIREAAFSSVVNVTLSEAGKKEYVGAVKYQVYFEDKPITQMEVLGKATTAFPARKANDKVSIKLIKADNKVAYSVDLNLQKENVAK